MAELRIKTEDDLKEWLLTQPIPVSEVIAVRAALRALPYYGYDFLHGKQPPSIMQPIFWAVQGAWAECRYPYYKRTTDAAYAASKAASRAAYAASDRASHAGYAASLASDTCIEFKIISAATRAATAASHTAHTHPQATIDHTSSPIWRETVYDCSILEQLKVETKAVVAKPLWRNEKMPQDMAVIWRELKTDLRDADDDWDLWADWYEARLTGSKTIDLPDDILESLEVNITEISQKLWKGKPAPLNHEIKDLIDGAEREAYARFLESTSDNRPGKVQPPAIPEQAEGIHFTLSNTQKVVVDLSGPLDGDAETALFFSLRDEMLQIADELVTSTRGSNAFAMLHRIAVRYHTALNADVTDNSLTQLVIQGTLLDIEKEGIEAEVANGALPALDRTISTPLNGLIASHAMAVLSTKVGRILHQKEREYNASQEEQNAFKDAAQPVVDAIETSDIAEAETIALLKDLIDHHGKGPHPERTGLLSTLALGNFLKFLGGAAIGAAMGAGFIAAAPGSVVVQGSTEFFNLVFHFLDAHSRQLIALANHSRGELSWLKALIDWLKVKRPEIMVKLNSPE